MLGCCSNQSPFCATRRLHSIERVWRMCCSGLSDTLRSVPWPKYIVTGRRRPTNSSHRTDNSGYIYADSHSDLHSETHPYDCSENSRVEVRTQRTPTHSPTSYYVGNTGGDGVYIRRSPELNDRIRAWPDGTTMISVGDIVVVDYRKWQNVRDPDGNVGFVPSAYLRVNRGAASVVSKPTATPVPAGGEYSEPQTPADIQGSRRGGR